MRDWLHCSARTAQTGGSRTSISITAPIGLRLREGPRISAHSLTIRDGKRLAPAPEIVSGPMITRTSSVSLSGEQNGFDRFRPIGNGKNENSLLICQNQLDPFSLSTGGDDRDIVRPSSLQSKRELIPI